MHSILVVILSTLNLAALRAEVFIGPTTATNRLLISSNQAIIISSVIGNVFTFGSLVFNGVTNSVGFDLPDVMNNTSVYAAVGPSELVLPTNTCFSFKRLENTTVQMLVVSNTQTGVVSVPSNKTIKFFLPLSTSSSFQGAIQKGPQIAAGYVFGGAEFTGPCTIQIPGPIVVSYYFTEDALVLPQAKVIQGPTGSFEIAIEKSYDLTNWFPVVAHNSVSDQKAFFKLRIR